MNYDVIIGIEIHAELKTKTKMFSAAKVGYNKEVNTMIDVAAVGYPGSMPTLNKQAVKLALWACKAFDMQIDTNLRFDRKHYYYSDLAKGYQTTQQYYPIGLGGKVVTDNGKTIELTRLHIEEDTAKQTHGDVTKIDYNRSGNPLIELVTEPVIYSANEAADFINKVRETLEFLHISDAKMNEGSLRCDVNISLKPKGQKEFGTKVEVKNLNSVSNVKDAIEFEIKRQSKLLDEGKTVQQETRRWDEASNTAILMRVKDGEVFYNFIYDSNMRPVQLDESFTSSAYKNMYKTYSQRLEALTSKDISDKVAKQILTNVDTADYFEELIKEVKDINSAANVFTNQLALSTSIEVSDLAKLLNANLPSTTAKDVLALMIKGETFDKAFKAAGTVEELNTDDLVNALLAAIADDAKGIEKAKQKLADGINYYMKYVLKIPGAKANMKQTREIMQKVISDEL